jgi:hypothetical protein
LRKSVDVQKKGEPGLDATPGSAGSAKSAGQRTGNPREETRRQTLSVLQHEPLVSRISEEFFHARAHTSLLAARQL